MKQLILFLAGLVAPVVTLFYRKGIWVTPDDPVSPYGQYEPKVRWVYDHFGRFIGDWYWLGIRNSAYGLAYKWKPQVLKNREGGTYEGLHMVKWQDGNTRTIKLFGPEVYTETCMSFGIFHIIYGYRLRPVYDTMMSDLPVRHLNMDGRPIFSIRFGKDDN